MERFHIRSSVSSRSCGGDRISDPETRPEVEFDQTDSQ